MFLLEHDAKALLAGFGVPIPAGVLIEAGAPRAGIALPPRPWVVKAQVPTGGRGKAGGVRPVKTEAEAWAAVDSLLALRIRGIAVHAVRVESRVAGIHEAYVSLALDPAEAAVRVMMAAEGGVEVESLAARAGAIRSALASADPASLRARVRDLTDAFPSPLGPALAEAGMRMAEAFLGAECLLVEVNPLFVRADGSWVAGDAKVIVDGNAVPRQAALKELLERRAHAYPEAALKERHGFDYVVVDPEGEIGLLTTGAGLSMMLIDEMRSAGLRPYNFLDIRTGGLRGDPTRLVTVLRWIAEGRRIKGLLVNIFAGITHLGEFSRLLVAALARVPELDVPVVARLVGNGLEEAQTAFAGSARRVELYTDLAPALERIVALIGGREAAR